MPKPLQINAQASGGEGQHAPLPTAAILPSATPTSPPLATPTSVPAQLATLPESFTLPATLPAYSAPFGIGVGSLDQGRPLRLHSIWVEVSGEPWNGAGATGLVWINLADLPALQPLQP